MSVFYGLLALGGTRTSPLIMLLRPITITEGREPGYSERELPAPTLVAQQSSLLAPMTESYKRASLID
jgi:hypothetical protein